MAWKVIIPLVERMLSSAGEVTFHLRKENRLLQEWGGEEGGLLFLALTIVLPILLY